MAKSSTPDPKVSKNADSEINESSISDTALDLSTDQDYLTFLKHYQNAEFSKSMEILELLEVRYPDDPILKKYKENLQLKLSLRTVAFSYKRAARKNKFKTVIEMGIFALPLLVIVMLIFFFYYYYFNGVFTTNDFELEATQLSLLNDQVEQLLLVGQPQPASEIINTIRLINPNYENLPELVSQTNDLLRLEGEYQRALDLLTEGYKFEALVVFREIDAEKSGLWDVGQQIASLETSIQIANYLEVGEAAYAAGNWGQVINAYENVLILEPQFDDPMVTERLLMSYLNQIISMLQLNEVSIEDISAAEQYYRRAIAMVPQNREFASERGNLQDVSSNLLELKFTQIAKANLRDNNQTASSINQAVIYMRKAANINSKNVVLQMEVEKAEYYQIAFQGFIEGKWTSAINNLNEIISVDPNYANGNANILLYEAYYSLAKQYYSAGFYQDALRNLEQAEFIAWNDNKNLMKLFQVQILSGDTYGKMADYENAVSYYQYALAEIEILSRLTNYPGINLIFTEATNWTVYGNYENAFFAYQDLLSQIDVIYSIYEI